MLRRQTAADVGNQTESVWPISLSIVFPESPDAVKNIAGQEKSIQYRT